MIALILCFIAMALTGTVLAAQQTDSVSYVERSWNSSGVSASQKTVNATKITASNADWVDLYDGWYYVTGNVEMGGGTTLRINGSTKLILCDGCTLTVKEGVYIKDECRLTIYGQSKDTGTLNASHHSGGNPGIGAR